MFYKYIYLLEHTRVLEYDDTQCPIKERKRLGFFLKRKDAINAISLLTLRPGFSKYPNDFVIKMIKLNVKNLNCFSEKNLKIYSVEHEYYDSDGDYDVVTQCGFFSDLAVAELFVKKLMTRREFCNHLDGFNIYESTINSISELWSEGFE